MKVVTKHIGGGSVDHLAGRAPAVWHGVERAKNVGPLSNCWHHIFFSSFYSNAHNFTPLIAERRIHVVLGTCLSYQRCS
jgi:hypothetical protein